jgi:drug/metabolite transporter superfamily protein YnfA
MWQAIKEHRGVLFAVAGAVAPVCIVGVAVIMYAPRGS